MASRGPVLHQMVERGEWLLIRCLYCGREKVISGHEACYTFGHGLTFQELRAVIRGRCKTSTCQVNAGVASDSWVPRVRHAKSP
jgi:hypothetical protein